MCFDTMQHSTVLEVFRLFKLYPPHKSIKIIICILIPILIFCISMIILFRLFAVKFFAVRLFTIQVFSNSGCLRSGCLQSESFK